MFILEEGSMIENTTFYDDVMSKTYGTIQTRTLLRFKHLETDGWRKLSDILNASAYAYAYGGDIYMLTSYLSNEPGKSDMAKLQSLIEENIRNPEINWSAIFNYLEDRLQTEQDWGYCYTLKDIIKILNQYKDQIPKEDNFVLY